MFQNFLQSAKFFPFVVFIIAKLNVKVIVSYEKIWFTSILGLLAISLKIWWLFAITVSSLWLFAISLSKKKKISFCWKFQLSFDCQFISPNSCHVSDFNVVLYRLVATHNHLFLQKKFLFVGIFSFSFPFLLSLMHAGLLFCTSGVMRVLLWSKSSITIAGLFRSLLKMILFVHYFCSCFFYFRCFTLVPNCLQHGYLLCLFFLLFLFFFSFLFVIDFLLGFMIDFTFS